MANKAELATASQQEIGNLAEYGLYRPSSEHDACGVGFVAHIKGKRAHGIVQQGLKILENLDHRGAVGADKLMGCLLYTSPSPRDGLLSRMPSSA